MGYQLRVVGCRSSRKGVRLQRTRDLVHKLVHMYMIFYKLRRRAWKIAAKTYPDLTESRDVRKNVALKRLIGRLELDAAMSQHRT